MINIIHEDFTDFSQQEFPYDKEHSALGEYHYIKHKGYTGSFYDPISLHKWRGLGGSWLFTNSFGKYYLEQNRGDFADGHFKDVSTILTHKEVLYAKYDLSFYMTLLETNKPCGICFNYIHNRLYDALTFDGTYLYLYHKDQDKITYYLMQEFKMESLEEYFIEFKWNDTFDLYLNGKLIFKTKIDFIKSKVSFIGKSPARFRELNLSMTEENYNIHLHGKQLELEMSLKKEEKYPKIELIHKIDLKGHGSGRQLRISYLDGRPVFLFAQHQKRMYRDAFARLSCLTLFDYDGNILWRIGTSNKEENGPISCDLPFQIADINNDGKEEVIFSMDFYVYILDLKTGKVLSKMKTPYVKNDSLVGDYPYDYLNPDGMRVADFEGLGYKGDFILKDRYNNVWAYRASDFKLLFRYNHKNTGHFPYIYDFNNDGYDEMFVGYDMTQNGKVLWSLDMNSDHTDEIICASYKKGEEKRLYLASGNEGFNIVNLDGTIFKHNNVGHAQRISLAPYRGKNSLDVCVTSFWGADMIVYLFDGEGNKLCEKELESNGNLVSPVLYDGIHTLILTNASSTDGGLLDDTLDRVVKFPFDNHPTLTAEVYDIDKDGVDEILTFDMDYLYIYKASKYKTGPIYHKYPDNSFSNYRGEYLLKYDSED